MKMVPYDVTKLGMYARSNNLDTLMDFIDSGFDCVKLEGYTQKNAKNCRNSLENSIKNYRLGGIQVVVRGENVFLVRKKIE